VTIGADACRVSFGYWLEKAAAGQEVVVTRRGRPMIRLSAVAPAPRTLAITPLPSTAEGATA
jgi:antitoxin (DNA-binding transcriptional repressor) of toxin-antitoxin stability system